MNVIDLSGFDRLGIDGSALAADTVITRTSSSVVEFDSKTTTDSRFEYIIPGPLPPGAKLTLVCETKFISGDPIRLQFDSATVNDYTTGLQLEGRIDGTSETEFVESRLTTTVAPGRQYYKALIGYNESRIGKAALRGLRLIVEGADLLTTKPDQMIAPSHSRTWTPSEHQKQWLKVTSGTGAVTDNADSTSLVAAAGNSALIKCTSADTAATKNRYALKEINTSKGFTVAIRGVRNSGTPSVIVEYTDGGDPATLVVTRRGVNIANDNDWSTFWFPPIAAASVAWIAVGFDGLFNEGDFDLKEIKIEQFGSVNQSGLSLRPFICKLVWDPNGPVGTNGWFINDDAQNSPAGIGDLLNASSGLLNIVSVSTSTITIAIDADAKGGALPVIMGEVGGNNNKVDEFYTGVYSTNNNVFVDILRRNTGNGAGTPDSTINPQQMQTETGGTGQFFINIIGFGLF